MSWFYMENRQEIGPISKDELQALVRSKKVTGSTLVKGPGMADWKALSTIASRKNNPPEKSDETPPQVAPTSPPPVMDTPAPGKPSGPICNECGRLFPPDQMVNYQGHNVCADCKGTFVQKLKEGVSPTGSMRFGGFWIRFAAKIIDSIITNILVWIVMFVLGGMIGILDGSNTETLGIVFGIGIYLLAMMIPLAYTITFVGKYGATPGKMACGLKIVTAENTKVTYKRAAGRALAEMLSGIILCIGYLIAAFDEEKRSLHDRICDTRVVKK